MAIDAHLPWIALNYEPSGGKCTSWKAARCAVERLKLADPTGKDCDEYPFLASVQGGKSAAPTPHLLYIDSGHNQLQGNRYSTFLGSGPDGCRIAPGDRFLVIPLVVPHTAADHGYDAAPIETKNICNGHGI